MFEEKKGKEEEKNGYAWKINGYIPRNGLKSFMKKFL